MMIRLIQLISVLFFSQTIGFGQHPRPTVGNMIIGERVFLESESPHPYTAALEKGTITWTDTIKFKEASYIKIHFEAINLSEGDQLIVRSPDYSRKYEFYAKYNDYSSWTGEIQGNEAIIEIVSNNEKGAYGYKIDKISRGFSQSEKRIANSIDNIHEVLEIESPHPYAAALEKGTITWTDTIQYTAKDATYIAFRFKEFNLSAGDQLILRSLDSASKHEYGAENNNRPSFWTGQVNGNEAIIEIISNNEKGEFGYEIDKIAWGYATSARAVPPPKIKSNHNFNTGDSWNLKWILGLLLLTCFLTISLWLIITRFRKS